MIKLSEYLDTPPMGEVVAERKKREKMKEAKRLSRLFSAAKSSRSNSGWTTWSTTANYELRTSLAILRGRAREMCRNNGYGKKFLSDVTKNVIGHKGIQLQSRAQMMDGSPNTLLNDKVETAFREWGKKRSCTVSGKMSWLDCQQHFVRTLGRDGEVLIRLVRGARNRFGFSLKFIDVSYLDETYNEIAPNGNRIIMSVEVDADDRPVAYYLTTPSSDYWLQQQNRLRRVRVPAEEMIHAFVIREDESETRGTTWFHTALIDAKNLHGYKDGVILSARVAANSFGFIIPPEDDIGPDYDGTDDEREQIELSMDPISVQELPPGYKFEQFDPKQPNQNHPEFYKSILHDVAASLEVDYTTLSGDLSDVNYSSIRSGKLSEQDLWRTIQGFVIEHFCQEVYEVWLSEAVLSGGLEISPNQMMKVMDPAWRPRGWSWVDPQKEMTAQVTGLQNNTTTLTDELAAQGKDLEEHFKTLAAEKALAAKYGIELKYGTQTSQPAAEAEDTEADGEAGGSREGYTNGEYSSLEN